MKHNQRLVIANLITGVALCVLTGPVTAQTIRDSAGIRIVTHSATAQPQKVWRVAPKPVVEIGGAEGTGPTMFTTIWGAARSANGDIVVSDEPAQELRVFDSTSKHLRTFGRKGQGPGEFSQIRGVVIYGDTVYALDHRRGTAVFTLAGKLLRQTPFPSLSPYHPIDPWGVLADGSVIEGATQAPTREQVQQTGTRIEMRGLFRIARDSRSAALLAVIPTYEFFRSANDPPDGQLVAFAPSMSVAVSSDRVCTGRGERYEIRCMNGAGQLSLIVRRAITPARVTSIAREAYLKRIRTPSSSPGHEAPPQITLDQIAARTHFATTFPAFDRVMPGSDGDVWVSEFRYQSRTRPWGEEASPNETTRWNVFAKDGAWIGAVELATRFVPMHITREHVLGVNRDDDGVQRVTLCRLLR